MLHCYIVTNLIFPLLCWSAGQTAAPLCPPPEAVNPLQHNASQHSAGQLVNRTTAVDRRFSSSPTHPRKIRARLPAVHFHQHPLHLLCRQPSPPGPVMYNHGASCSVTNAHLIALPLVSLVQKIILLAYFEPPVYHVSDIKESGLQIPDPFIPLSDLGRSLIPIVNDIGSWGKLYLSARPALSLNQKEESQNVSKL